MFCDVITMHINILVNEIKKFYKQHINLQKMLCKCLFTKSSF